MIKKHIVSFFNNLRISKIIRNYKYVHIIQNDKFCEPFISFINRNFPLNDHVFLVQKKGSFDILDDKNVIVIDSLWGLDFSSDNIKQVIMHSLFIVDGALYWFLHMRVLEKKVWWMIYGADLYNPPKRIRDKVIRKHFRGYISDTDGDCDVAKIRYNLGNDKIFINAGYSFPITSKMIDAALSKKKPHDYVRIQINNSCDKSTIDILKQLKQYDNQNIQIATVVSYGKIEYKNEIIQTGNELYGNRFVYLDMYLSPSEYAEWLSENDIYILDQNRQQGLGNSFASLALGAKLYIRSDVTTYGHFNEKGIKVFDTLLIPNLEYDEFVKYENDTRTSNMSMVRQFFKDSYLKGLWELVFSKV